MEMTGAYRKNELYRWLLIVIGVGVACLAGLKATAQTYEGMIYGKVVTRGTTYTGLIRWGKEEVLWTDLFNAAKTNNNYKDLVPEQKKDNDSWLGYDWSFSSIWEDKRPSHQFTCQFGDIATITPLPRSQARIAFKNGGKITVSGEGYNDIGGRIQVLDDELGVVSLEWDKIERIEFMSTAPRLKTVFGSPIYGTVEGMRKQTFTGFIVWDNDERLSTDPLDGTGPDGKMAIRFGDIASIEKSGKGSLVKLRSGREFMLHGSNDVNNENRGVFVAVPEVGIIKLPWSAFRRITFTTPGRPVEYQHFKAPGILTGTVYPIEGSELSGRIIFDIDEALDLEMVEGKDDDIEYIVPLRNIRRIKPKNFDYSMVELRSGESLLLGGQRDVSSQNGGVLVFMKGTKEPKYVAWKNINEIVFD